MTIHQGIFTDGLGEGVVVGLAVVFPITRSRLYDNGSGKHGQNAVVQIVDIIVGRLIDLIAPDLEAQGVGATTVGYVRNCSLLDDLYPVTGNEGIFLHKVIAAVALGLAVVDERVAIRTECEGLGMDDQLAVFIGDLVVFRDVLVGGVQNHDRQGVVCGAVPYVGNLVQGGDLGSVTIHEGRLLADDVTVPAVGDSVVGPFMTLGDHRDLSGKNGQLAADVGDVKVDRYVVVVGIHDRHHGVVVHRSVPYVGNSVGGQHNGLMIRRERGFVADGVVFPALSLAVVGEFVAFGDDGNGSRVDHQHTVDVGDVVVGGYVGILGIHNGYRDHVVHRAFPCVGDLCQRKDMGALSLGQGGFLADGEIVLAMRLAVIGPGTVGSQDGYGTDLHRQNTCNKADHVIVRLDAILTAADGDTVLVYGYRGLTDYGLGAEQSGLQDLTVDQVVHGDAFSR